MAPEPEKDVSLCDIVGLPDIEDLEAETDSPPRERKYKKSRLKVHRPKRNVVRENVEMACIESEGGIPGTQSVWVKTWGCSHNSSDAEYMSGLLSEYGYPLVTDPSSADLWLLNSCTVKSPAELHFRNMIEQGLSSSKKIVVSGCVPQGAPASPYLKDVSVVGVENIDRVTEVVEETLKGNVVRLIGKSNKSSSLPSLNLPKIRRNPLIEIIPINSGCLNQCTYCKTRFARGHLKSYPPLQIVERAIQAFNEGVVELWVTSEDTGAYGLDIGYSLPQLLNDLLETVPDNCRLRVGMTNPPYIRDCLEEISEVLQHRHMYRFLHLPIQSASDAVLADMKREYCKEDFSDIVDFLSSRVSGLNIATDFICGFPTETEEDFMESCELLEKYKFQSVFINQFFPRPGTPAAKFKQIDGREIKSRTRKLNSIFQSYHPFDGREGEIIKDVLFTEKSNDGSQLIGHNISYEQIRIEAKSDKLLGKMVDVQIDSVSKFCMIGHPIIPPVSPIKYAPLLLTGAIIMLGIVILKIKK